MFITQKKWQKMFFENERLDFSQDSYAEYTEKNLQDFMISEFMTSFANDCIQTLANNGREDYLNYLAIKTEMSSMLQKYGYPPFSALEDAYSEQKQLEILKEFKVKYLNSK